MSERILRQNFYVKKVSYTSLSGQRLILFYHCCRNITEACSPASALADTAVVVRQMLTTGYKKTLQKICKVIRVPGGTRTHDIQNHNLTL